jgi:hypothetical protein
MADDDISDARLTNLIFRVPPGTTRYWAFPYGPLWPGFIVDVIVFSLVIGASVESVRALRRMRRQKRRLCTACAYPLGIGSVCPECGLSQRSA